MGEFVRILKISKNVIVSIQLLQTMSIMIQNLKSDHSICKLFVLVISRDEYQRITQMCIKMLCSFVFGNT